MSQIFKGVLRRLGESEECATCTFRIDSDRMESMTDAEVSPQLPDGEYDLEVNGVHRLATRVNGQWTECKY